MPADLNKDHYTSGEIGRMLGIPARTARRYLHSGRIPATQNAITSRWKVTREMLDEFLRKHGLEEKPGDGESRPLQIVVVDDEEWVASFVKEALETSVLGAAVTAFTNSHEACLHLGSGTPDLVILDLRMPGIDGPQLLSMLRQNPKTRQAPVLIISGYPDDFRGLEQNATLAFLAKPFDLTQLLTAVCNILDLPPPEAPS